METVTELQTVQALMRAADGKTVTAKLVGGDEITGTAVASTTAQMITITASGPTVWLVPAQCIVALTAA